MKSFQNNPTCFTIIPGLFLIACVILSGVADAAPPENQFVLGSSSESLALNADGALQRLGQ
jgi:hypothetical protein